MQIILLSTELNFKIKIILSQKKKYEPNTKEKNVP